MQIRKDNCSVLSAKEGKIREETLDTRKKAY